MEKDKINLNSTQVPVLEPKSTMFPMRSLNQTGKKINMSLSNKIEGEQYLNYLKVGLLKKFLKIIKFGADPKLYLYYYFIDRYSNQRFDSIEFYEKVNELVQFAIEQIKECRRRKCVVNLVRLSEKTVAEYLKNEESSHRQGLKNCKTSNDQIKECRVRKYAVNLIRLSEETSAKYLINDKIPPSEGVKTGQKLLGNESVYSQATASDTDRTEWHGGYTNQKLKANLKRNKQMKHAKRKLENKFHTSEEMPQIDMTVKLDNMIDEEDSINTDFNSFSINYDYGEDKTENEEKKECNTSKDRTIYCDSINTDGPVQELLKNLKGPPENYSRAVNVTVDMFSNFLKKLKVFSEQVTTGSYEEKTLELSETINAHETPTESAPELKKREALQENNTNKRHKSGESEVLSNGQSPEQPIETKETQSYNSRNVDKKLQTEMEYDEEEYLRQILEKIKEDDTFQNSRPYPFVNEEISSGVNFTVNKENDLPVIDIDRNEPQNLLENLCSNSYYKRLENVEVDHLQHVENHREDQLSVTLPRSPNAQSPRNQMEMGWPYNIPDELDMAFEEEDV